MRKDIEYWRCIGKEYRLFLPRYERRYPWLSLMLEAFSVVEASMAQAIKAAPAVPACRSGCIPCCRQEIIPLTPLEAETLYFWIREKLEPDPATHVLSALHQAGLHGPKDCPFLLNGTCTAYPVRPIACRRFMVLSVSCGITEDCLSTRPQDVLSPSRSALYAALALTAPFYRRIGLLPKGQEPDFAFFTRISLNLQHLPFGQRKNSYLPVGIDPSTTKTEI